MRVALSVDALSPQLTGIGRYCWELAQRLPAHRDVESVDHYIGGRQIVDPARLLREQVNKAKPLHRRLSAPLGRVRARWAARRADVVHGPNYRLPGWAETGVVTVHDLSVFKFPEMHPASRVAEFEREFRRTMDRAGHVITDCEAIRQEVIDFAGLSPSRVTAVPLGVGPEFRPLGDSERAKVLEKHRLPLTGYGLTVSSLEPRKRIDKLLAAWAELPRRLRDRYPLVIAGAEGWHNQELRERIVDATAEGWAIHLGFVSETDLPAIYAGAKIFAYPSIYEGFGLPPLEAMASGVPTLVAAASCLAEVTKGGARAIEPEDIRGFADTVAEVLDDSHWRAEAASAGIHIARGYSWQACVDQSVEVYGKFIERG